MLISQADPIVAELKSLEPETSAIYDGFIRSFATFKEMTGLVAAVTSSAYQTTLLGVQAGTLIANAKVNANGNSIYDLV